MTDKSSREGLQIAAYLIRWCNQDGVARVNAVNRISETERNRTQLVQPNETEYFIFERILPRVKAQITVDIIVYC